MGAYENGVSTRKVILDSCKKLFYEKGYHETSYDDICKMAHVNRGSIYYHFKEKENIRYEVLWEMTKQCCDIAKQYCDDERYIFFMGTYIFWGKTLVDAKLRKYFLDYYADYPVCTPNNPVAIYYHMCNKSMFGELWKQESIKPLAIATVYSNIYGVLRLMNENPEAYVLDEIYEHAISSGILIWNMPKEEMKIMQNQLFIYKEKIPKAILEIPLEI